MSGGKGRGSLVFGLLCEVGDGAYVAGSPADFANAAERVGRDAGPLVAAADGVDPGGHGSRLSLSSTAPIIASTAAFKGARSSVTMVQITTGSTTS